MKRIGFVLLVLLSVSFLLVNVASAQKMHTATGKVTAIDPEGKAIVIETGSGEQAMVVGTIVGPDTTVKVKGKKAGLGDIEVGDKVTVRYEKSTDLYAKQITKR